MELRITILCDNDAGQSLQLIGEHGFAAFIETPNENFLFDTGQGMGLVSNALALEKDLRSIKKVFLSHGHRDHTGGLSAILRICRGVELYAHPDIFLPRFSIRTVNGGQVKRNIGTSSIHGLLWETGGHLKLEKDFLQITDRFFLTGEIPRIMPFEKGDPHLYKEEENQLVTDSVLDDQSLIVKTNKGLVVLLGCAHSGLMNILHQVRNKFPEDRIHAILGGTHLGFLKEDQKWESIGALQDFDFDKIGACHCTGQQAACAFFQVFPEKFLFTYVGLVLEV